jgi:hypothetical protein
MDKAARQEAELRQAQHDLELQKAQEATLARELADREEGFADLDRDFKDLQEEEEAVGKVPAGSAGGAGHSGKVLSWESSSRTFCSARIRLKVVLRACGPQ